MVSGRLVGVAVCVGSRCVGVIGPLGFVVRGLVRWCAAATGTGRPRVRLGAFLARWSIWHVPCDVQARFWQ